MVRNPLNKRYVRELKSDFGKYLVIFLLLVLCIGFTSGFMVADNSIVLAYNNSFQQYNVEDGHFSTEKKMNVAQHTAVEQHGIQVYDLFYNDVSTSDSSTIRIFEKRTQVNLECLMEGDYPKGIGEIAIDRMYADNNDLSVGDTIQISDGTVLTVSGLVALSDYSALFQNNNDIMFDATKFAVGIVTSEQFILLDDANITWCYAWKYNDSSIAGSGREEDAAKDLMSALNEEVVLKTWIPQYQNQAITFTGEDMSSDGAMMIAFLYIVVVIIAFVFAITTKDTIRKESNVIGTLRASGYFIGELVRHYMVMPMIITVISAIIGNILGYTLLKDVCAAMYYGSYSLPTYVTVWNANAFLETTLVPCLIMAIVTFLVLARSLTLSPLKFLRNDLSRKKHRKALYLSHKLSFFGRFRIRAILQNVASYLLLFIGILFGNLLLMFGLALPTLLTNYQNNIADNMLAKYQTLLTVPSNALDEDRRFASLLHLLQFSKAVETDVKSAEKFSVYTLKTPESDTVRSEEIMLYGIEDNSTYVSLPGDGVYISSLYADKYEIDAGATVTLYETFEETDYTFVIDGVIDYEGAVCLFMPIKELNDTFDLGDDYFAGYFSDQEIDDIDAAYIGSVIDYDTLTTVSRQLMVSMGSMMYVLDGFCVVMFIILMYLLSKLIIEKNAQSISLTKILGYNQWEISRLYVHSITLVTMFCILLSLPICYVTLTKVYRVMLKQMMSGWLRIVIPSEIYILMILLGFASYGIVALLEIRKIKNIPMDQALKNAE